LHVHNKKKKKPSKSVSITRWHCVSTVPRVYNLQRIDLQSSLREWLTVRETVHGRYFLSPHNSVEPAACNPDIANIAGI